MTSVDCISMEEVQGDSLGCPACLPAAAEGHMLHIYQPHSGVSRYPRSSQMPLLRTESSHSFLCDGSSARSTAASCLPESLEEEDLPPWGPNGSLNGDREN